MGLLSSLFSRPGGDGGATGADPDAVDSVAQARTRARQRLLGAVVLVGAGIVGFPLLFETQPRPIPVDVPIDIPRKESAAPLVLPSAKPAGGKASSAAPSSRADTTVAARSPSGNEVITETAAEAGLAPAKPPAEAKPASAARAADKAPERAADRPTERTADKTADKPTDKPADKPAERVAAASAADAARAQALLDGKPAAASTAAPTRFIVQIGAFADPVQARETRLKVERLGLVTYTHVAQTPQGDRTRVRVGPVPTRQEAEKVAAKIKAAGLPAAILTL